MRYAEFVHYNYRSYTIAYKSSKTAVKTANINEGTLNSNRLNTTHTAIHLL